MSGETVPRLTSVGLPVLNGERYLEEALEALLAQDYEPLEIVISDNGSTDRTPDICRALARRDNRIRYHRFETTSAGHVNFNRVLGLSRGEFYLWAADDDLRSPRMISSCVAALDADPAAVLAYTDIELIDEHGAVLETRSVPLELDGLDAAARCRRVIQALDTYDVVYGVMRGDVVRRNRGSRLVWAPCVPLALDLAAAGSYAHVPEVLFSKRYDAGETFGSDSWRARVLAITIGHEEYEQRRNLPTETLVRELRDVAVASVFRTARGWHTRVRAAAAVAAGFESVLGVDLPLARGRTRLRGRSLLGLAAVLARRPLRDRVYTATA
jgi:glycosyltransferase involved in cell wall biosynthesis